MALEITYAEVRFKTESKTSGTNSLPPDAPKEKTTFQQNNPGFLRLFLATLLIFFLLLAISFLVAFIIFFQKYSKLLQEKKTLTESSQKHSELECIKTSSTTEGKIYSTKNAVVESSILFHLHVLLSNKGKVWSCCPKNWKSFSFHCYLFSTDSKSWNESAENCYKMGAHLGVINTKEEQDFIMQNLKISYFYIGLSDPEGQRHWQWVDHTPYNESATFWHSRQSNDIYNQCVMVTRYYHQWGWNAVSCNSKLHSICEMMKIYL
uniref:C-type lectin domain family 4 member A-like n=1 Tax=Chinchilla lanigera TaxID=34839 RepID=A0A8C2W462_CHILA